MPEINILSNYCKGCGYCVKNCPKSVLEIGENSNPSGYQYAVPVRPDDCIACKLCAVCCPDSAVEIYK